MIFNVVYLKNIFYNVYIKILQYTLLYIYAQKKYIYDYNKCYKNNLGNFVSFNISD